MLFCHKMISKIKLLVMIFTTLFVLNAFASDAKESSITALLNRFTLDDMNQIYQSCGDTNSLATTCATSFNKIVKNRFTNVQPITASEVNTFWDQCYDGSNDTLCAKSLNAILKTHMPANSHYVVSKRDVEQIKHANFLGSNPDYSSLIKQASDFFGAE